MAAALSFTVAGGFGCWSGGPSGFEVCSVVWSVLFAGGSNVRGAVYALLELADRVNFAADPLAALKVDKSIFEQSNNPIRSISGINSAALCACPLNTVLRHPTSGISGWSSPTRSRKSTACRSHGRPQSWKSFPLDSVCANTQCSM